MWFIEWTIIRKPILVVNMQAYRSFYNHTKCKRKDKCLKLALKSELKSS